MTQPILSIVIPTKDRYGCLTILVSSLLAFRRSDFEIIIADNSPDNTPWLEFYRESRDPRIKYHHDPVQMPIITNCDIGVRMATATYICMLGDDDGIAEWALDLADWMKRGGIDAVLANRPVYLWPGVQGRVLGGDDGTLAIEEPTGAVRSLDVDEQLDAVLRRGGTDLQMIPRLYHGLVSREAVQALIDASGTAFPGPSPDMANGVGLCRFVRSMRWIDFPVVITGNMPRSGGGMGAARQHVGSLTKPHLPPDTEATWTPYIPKFWSGPTIWAESAVKALRFVNPALEGRFNVAYLLAACVVFHRHHRPEIAVALGAATQGRPGRRVLMIAAVAWYTGLVLMERAVSLVRNVAARFGVAKRRTLSGLMTIADVMRYVDRAYGSQPRPWDRHE